MAIHNCMLCEKPGSDVLTVPMAASPIHVFWTRENGRAVKKHVRARCRAKKPPAASLFKAHVKIMLEQIGTAAFN